MPQVPLNIKDLEGKTIAFAAMMYRDIHFTFTDGTAVTIEPSVEYEGYCETCAYEYAVVTVTKATPVPAE